MARGLRARVRADARALRGRRRRDGRVDGRRGRVDPTQLHQIVWNLCDNAVKYASATAGAIAVELGCRYRRDLRRPFIEVADRGPGVQPEQRRADLRAFLHGAARHGPRPVLSRELAQRTARRCGTTRGRAAAACSAWCSRTRAAGIRRRRDAMNPGRTGRRRRTGHPRAAHPHARAHGHLDANRAPTSRARSRRWASAATTCASPTCACPTATASSSSNWIQREPPGDAGRGDHRARQRRDARCAR